MKNNIKEIFPDFLIFFYYRATKLISREINCISSMWTVSSMLPIG